MFKVRSSFVVLGLSLLLVACGGDPASPQDSQIQPQPQPEPKPQPEPEKPRLSANRLTGTLPGWPYAAAHLVPEFVNGRNGPLEATAISAAGRVDVTLPEVKLAGGLLDGCTLSSGFVGGQVKTDLMVPYIYAKGADWLGSLAESNDKGLVARYYSEAATPLKGKATCGDTALTFDLDLKAGWNLVTLVGQPGGRMVLTPFSGNATTTLKFTKAAERLIIRPDVQAPLVLRRGQTFELPVQLYQDGGISGTVVFRTNVNGLDFPESVTLPTRIGMQSAGLGAQAVRTTLKLVVRDYVGGYKGPLQITAYRDNQPVGEVVLDNVEVRVPQLATDLSSMVVSQGERTAWTFNLYPQQYQGTVTVAVEGLPAGLSVAQQQVTVKGGEMQRVTLPLELSGNVPVGNWPVTIKLTQDSDGYVVSRPSVLTVMPRAIELTAGVGGMTAAADGALWYASGQGVTRQRPDGGADSFSDPGPRCGDLTLGQDGGIWEQSAPPVRFDPVTGTASLKRDPRGFSGCAGSGMHFDAKGRGWNQYGGIQRLDYEGNKVDTVPGTELAQLLDVEGTTVWAAGNVNGEARLVRIDGDTLTRTTLALPGLNTLMPAYARQGKLWFPKAVPSRLAVYDPATQAIRQFDVVVDGKPVRDFEVLGVDAAGRHWLELMRSEQERVFREWMLYDPTSGSVVKRSPAIFLLGSGQRKAVAPDGTLWVRTTDSQTGKTLAYVIRP